MGHQLEIESSRFVIKANDRVCEGVVGQVHEKASSADALVFHDHFHMSSTTVWPSPKTSPREASPTKALGRTPQSNPPSTDLHACDRNNAILAGDPGSWISSDLLHSTRGSILVLFAVLCYAVSEIMSWREHVSRKPFFSLQDELPESALEVGQEVWKFVRDKFIEGRLAGQGGDPLYARIDGVIDGKAEFILTEIELIEPGLGFGYGESGQAAVKALCDVLANT